MSVYALTWAWGVKAGSLGAKSVLVALANFSDEHGYCFPSQATIAKMTEQSARSIRRHLLDLEAAGIISRESRRRPDGSMTSDGFWLQTSQRSLWPQAEVAEGQFDRRPEEVSTSGQLRPLPAVTVSGPEPSVEPSVQPSVLDSAEPRCDSPPFITIPLVGKQGEFTVTEAMIVEWQEAFPAIDVRQKLKAIRVWNLENPENRKTAKGIRKHIVRWLTRDQDKAPVTAKRPARPELSTTCDELERGAREPCGLPGKQRGDGHVRCDHHELKRQEATRVPMKPEIRVGLDRLLKKTRPPQPDRV